MSPVKLLATAKKSAQVVLFIDTKGENVKIKVFFLAFTS
jgi:hypothetical protein